MNGGIRDRRQIAQAIEGGHQTVLLVKIMGIAYQLQSIGLPMFLDVLGNVTVPQPRADYREREQNLRNAEEREHVRMRNVLPLNDLAVEPLIGIGLSSSVHRNMDCHTPV